MSVTTSGCAAASAGTNACGVEAPQGGKLSISAKGASATSSTSPVCELSGCDLKVVKGGLCSKCRSVHYCGKEHQRRDWPSHKLVCKRADNPEPEGLGESSKPKIDPSGWAVGLDPRKQREWLVDCYRMRLDDDYAWGGDIRGGSLYDQSSPDEIVQDFLVFCRLALEQGAIPEGWNWPKFLATAVDLLPYAFEKSDAKEKYGRENVFTVAMGGRSLRFTGEVIYGSGIQSAEESEIYKKLARELKDKKRTPKMVEKVGGKRAWDSLEAGLWDVME